MGHFPECQYDELELSWKTLGYFKISYLEGNVKHQCIFIVRDLIAKILCKIHLLNIREVLDKIQIPKMQQIDQSQSTKEVLLFWLSISIQKPFYHI